MIALALLPLIAAGCYDFDRLREDDPHVKEDEVHAAGKSDDTSLDENLLRIVRHPDTYEVDVLTAAIDALAEHGTREALEPFLALRTHEDEEVRWHVARALKGYEDDAARAALDDMAANDASPMVREMCTSESRTRNGARP